MLVGEFGIAQFVLCFLVIDTGNDATFVGVVRAALLAPRGNQRHVGEIRRLALFECQLLRFDALPLEFHLALLERRLGLLQCTLEVRARDRRQDLPCDHLLPCLDVQRDRPGVRGVQRRAHRSNDTALHRHIANQVAPGNRSGADAIVRDADRRVRPALRPGRREQERRNDDNGRRAHQDPAFVRARRLDAHILR